LGRAPDYRTLQRPTRPAARRRAVTTPKTALVIALNKPHGVLCHFSGHENRSTLADYIDVPNVYPAGRLDADSEGLVLLTDDGALQAAIAHPQHKLPKCYWVQVEGTPSSTALDALRRGIALADGATRPAQVRVLEAAPPLWPRDPPIRFRRAMPTAWLELTIVEGRNRQVRRMTAAVGLPTLRLVRYSIGAWTVLGLAPGEWRRESAGSIANVRKSHQDAAAPTRLHRRRML